MVPRSRSSRVERTNFKSLDAGSNPAGGTFYVCDKCGDRLSSDRLINETDPDLWNNSMRELCFKLRADRGEPVPPPQSYHAAWDYGRPMKQYLCGPVHLETEQEYFIHWIGGSLKAR